MLLKGVCFISPDVMREVIKAFRRRDVERAAEAGKTAADEKPPVKTPVAKSEAQPRSDNPFSYLA